MSRRAGVRVSGNLEIRLLTPDDASEWWRLRQESLQQDPEAFSSSPEDRQSLSADDVRQRLSNPAGFFIVGAFDDRRLVGMSGFHREAGAKSRHKGGVWGVYVAPEWRGKGLGRRMMETLLEHAAKIEGVEQILIAVTVTQTAASTLYRSLGFEPFGIEPRAVKVGDRYFDEEHMLLIIRGPRQQ
jgi:ribosomal protein S18 acetylase RimI-like enzyme